MHKEIKPNEKIPFTLFLLFLTSENIFAQSDHWGITISTNLMKPFLGLANLGIEVKVANHYALHVDIEKELQSKSNHPDVIARIGMRYYPVDQEEFLSKSLL